MGSHDRPIDRKRPRYTSAATRVFDVMVLEIGDSELGLRMALATMIGAYPEMAERAILQAAHSIGRHSITGCPESCPEF